MSRLARLSAGRYQRSAFNMRLFLIMQLAHLVS
nr:MAG TPA: hypothetical protein [Caudoviricetes sp.]